MENQQQKNLILAIVLSTAVMFVWMEFFAPKAPPVVEGADAGALVAATGADAGAASALPSPAVSADGGEAAAQAPAPEAAPAIAEKSLPFSTATHELVFSNRGGGLEKAVIKNGGEWPQRKFVSREKNPEGELSPVNMVRPRSGAALPGATEIKGDLTLSRTAMYEVEGVPGQVTFKAQSPDVAVEKRFTFVDGSYELRLDVAVTNRTAAPKRASVVVAYPAWVDPKEIKTGGFFSPPPEVSQSLCRHDHSNHGHRNGQVSTTWSWKDSEKESYAGPVQFAGFDERYFTGLFFPRFAEGTRCTVASDKNGDYTADLEADLGTLAPGETARREFGLYLGPKELKELQRVSAENAQGAPITVLGKEPQPGNQAKIDPQLAESIDFGWWAVICRFLLWIMKIFQKAVVNWGLAIVLLTVLVKAVLYPLSVKQMASMESMRKLQPHIAELQKKYKDDREKLNMEQMRLYQEHKVNPFGGCLPLLIQMPVWIALYRTLLSSFELYREPLFSIWITDLTLHDPFYVLPLAMGVTMFITQKMQPTMGDPTQAKVMLYFMPILFTAMMLNLPAGLTLYIFTNNLLSIAQQKYLQHKFAKQDAAKAAAK